MVYLGLPETVVSCLILCSHLLVAEALEDFCTLCLFNKQYLRFKIILMYKVEKMSRCLRGLSCSKDKKIEVYGPF